MKASMRANTKTYKAHSIALRPPLPQASDTVGKSSFPTHYSGYSSQSRTCLPFIFITGKGPLSAWPSKRTMTFLFLGLLFGTRLFG